MREAKANALDELAVDAALVEAVVHAVEAAHFVDADCNDCPNRQQHADHEQRTEKPSRRRMFTAEEGCGSVEGAHVQGVAGRSRGAE